MRISVCMRIDAPRERVFEVFRNAVASMLARGGNPDVQGSELRGGEEFDVRVPKRGGATQYRIQILVCDLLDRLAIQIGDDTMSAKVDYRFRADPDAATSTTVDGVLDLDWASRIYRLLGRAMAWEIRRQVLQQMREAKAVAESDRGLPLTPPIRRGLWQRRQNEYKGLTEASAPGAHAAAIALLLAHVKPIGAVLDLGAGTGAWLARLHDAGFDDLSAVEIDAGSFGFEGVKPKSLDLNQNFCAAFDSRFQLITAIEIVEHLDCPRHFLRQVHGLLADGGHALLTMPNVGKWSGRIRFLLRGEHAFFEEPDYEQRHISPVTDLHMRLMFSEIGFRLIQKVGAGDFEGPLKKALAAPLALCFRLLLGPTTQGDVNIYLLAKDKPSSTALGRDSYYNVRVAQAFRPVRTES